LVESSAAPLLTPVGHLRAPGQHQHRVNAETLTFDSQPNPETTTLKPASLYTCPGVRHSPDTVPNDNKTRSPYSTKIVCL